MRQTMSSHIEIANKFSEDNILIIDFGSQYTQLIARRVREEGVFCQIIPYNKVSKYIINNNPKGIILSGGPSSVLGIETPRISKEIIDMAINSILEGISDSRYKTQSIELGKNE